MGSIPVGVTKKKRSIAIAMLLFFFVIHNGIEPRNALRCRGRANIATYGIPSHKNARWGSDSRMALTPAAIAVLFVVIRKTKPKHA